MSYGFPDVDPRHPPPPHPARVLLGRMWRSPVARVVGALVASALIGSALYASWLYQRAWSEECAAWDKVDVSMEDLIRLRSEIRKYQQDPAPGAALVLTGDDVNVLLGEGRAFRMQAHFVGAEASLRLSLPQEEGCYNIDYLGSLEVRDGVVLLQPRHLWIGDADVGFLVGSSIAIEAEQFPEDELSKLIGNMSSLTVEGGEVHVRFDNRWDLW